MIIATQSPKRSDPQGAGLIFANGQNTVLAEAAGIISIKSKASKKLLIAIKAIQSTAPRSNPKCVRAIFIDNAHVAVAETVGIVRIMQKARKLLLHVIILVQPTLRANPKRAGVIFEYVPNAIIAQTVSIAGIM